MRKKQEVGAVKAISLKKGRQTIQIAKEGEEFGVIFKPQLDFKLGDVVVSVRKQNARFDASCTVACT